MSGFSVATVMSMRKLSDYDQSAVKAAQSALNAILTFDFDRDLAALKRMPATGVLYHYTTADGLKGIIENSELWASSAYFLNDPNEITYGCDLLKTVLDNWFTKAQAHGERNSFRSALVTELCTVFGEDLLEKKIIGPIYLGCFCEDDNLLSQWRAYGPCGGYSIGFRVPTVETVSLGPGFRPEPNTYTAKWARVEYEKSEQVKNCTAILDQMLAVLDSETANAIQTIDDHPFCGYAAFAKAIKEILLEEILRFKNEAFRVEKEWRIIVRRREFHKQSVDDGGKTPIPVYFRSSRGMLAPYVKLIPTNPPYNTLPIQSIRTGPTLSKETASIAISLMLDKKGYPPLKVDGSDIAVRL